MKNSITLLLLFIGFISANGQTATSITNLQTPTIDETSGLIFYNNKLITHTDSGGEAKLYEINTSTGTVIRTVVIANATNFDWEDIAQDATHIYIGDIGNNGGNRTNLKVYKISKADYNDADNTATAEIISYAYANQTDFTENVNNNNWDAEALISFGDKLLIFTKNWANTMTNVYSIPKTSGTHTAVLEGSFNVNGLLTGADVSNDEGVIFLTGYSSSAAPFMYTIHNIPANSFNVFSGTVSPKLTNMVSFGNQVEAVALFQTTSTHYKLYLSNERFSTFVGPIPFVFPAKLWSIEIENSTLAVTAPTSNSEFVIYPNPFDDVLKLNKKADEIRVYDVSGRKIATKYFADEFTLEKLDSGVYILEIIIGNQTTVKKVVKR